MINGSNVPSLCILLYINYFGFVVSADILLRNVAFFFQKLAALVITIYTYISIYIYKLHLKYKTKSIIHLSPV